MKTILFSGVAAAGLLLTTAQADASDSSHLGNMVSAADKLQLVMNGHKAGRGGPDRTGDYREPEYGPSIRPDSNAYHWNDDVAFAAPDGSSYSYDGEWNGEYVDPEARIFEGDWSGTVTRHDSVEGVAHPAPRYERQHEGGHHNGYQVPRGYENYERCLKSNGVTGAAIGAILGGVAGNRIAGRGDRLGGTLLGAGLGGLAGVAVEKAASKCKSHAPHYPAQSYYPPLQHHGWQGGYYYYPQAPMVTMTIVPGGSHTTTTVTEEVYYETVKTHPRKKTVRKWKPKPRCVCR